MAFTGAEATTSLRLLEVEPTVFVATARSRPCLSGGQVAALSVVAGEAALAGVVHRAGQAGALLMASMAGPESEPKLMAEMLTTDSAGRPTVGHAGRRAPLAEGRTMPSSWFPWATPVAGATSAKVRCLTMT